MSLYSRLIRLSINAALVLGLLTAVLAIAIVPLREDPTALVVVMGLLSLFGVALLCLGMHAFDSSRSASDGILAIAFLTGCVPLVLLCLASGSVGMAVVVIFGCLISAIIMVRNSAERDINALHIFFVNFQDARQGLPPKLPQQTTNEVEEDALITAH